MFKKTFNIEAPVCTTQAVWSDWAKFCHLCYFRLPFT